MKKLTNEEFLRRFYERGLDDIEVVGKYINSKTKILCRCKKCEYMFDSYPKTIIELKGCPKCRDRDPRVSKEQFLKRLSSMDNGINLIGKYVNMVTPTEFICRKKHTWSISPINITNIHSGCPYCAHRLPWIGETDLWTTRPDIARILKNPDDGYKYMSGSQQKAEFVCPDCGFVSKKEVKQVCTYGFACQMCSDSISYPNKFARRFLEQLPIDNFICEYQPKWNGRCSYDNYFEYNGKKYILEMDGGLHYDDDILFGTSLEERQVKDKIKTKSALENGIDIIRINCEKSDVNWISSHILQSKLSDIFDLSLIDWKKCDEAAQSNIVKLICDTYMNEDDNLDNLARSFHISKVTVREYLKRGTKIDWCNYNANDRRDKKKVDIVLLDNNGNLIKFFMEFVTILVIFKICVKRKLQQQEF